MRYSDDAFATIMLMSQAMPGREELVSPLSAGEYHALRGRVRLSSLRTMSNLAHTDMGGMMQYLNMPETEAYRICLLLNRVLPIAMSIEGFMNAGISIVTLDDERYPVQILDPLHKKAPPMLYYSGRPEVFKQWAVAILGNEPIVGDAEEKVRAFASRAVKEDLVIITDGTAGLGRIAEDQAYQDGGFCIEVLPGGMNVRLADERVQRMIAERQLLLLSIRHPDAPVSVSNALERNALLHALPLASIVFAVRENSGNTWEGAVEALKLLRDKYLYAWDTPIYPGNAKLIGRGAIPFDGDDRRFPQMFDQWKTSVAEQMSMFDRKKPRGLR